MSMIENKLVSIEYDEVKTCFVRRWYDRLRLQTLFEGESMTVQSEKDLTDINNIVARFDRTGELPPGREGVFGDVTHLNKPFQEIIDDADRIIDEAGKFITEADEKRKAEEKKQADIEKAELEQLRKAKKAALDSSADQPAFGGKGDKSP